MTIFLKLIRLRFRRFCLFSIESSSLATGGVGGLHLGPQMGQGQGVHVLLQASQDEDLYGPRH